jgi:hypothetical protein
MKNTLLIIIYLLNASFALFAQEVTIESKYGSSSSQATELMAKSNIVMSQECGNVVVTAGKTKLVATGNILIATTSNGKELLVFEYQTYKDSITVFKFNPKTQKFVVQLQSTELKELNFDDCNCDEYNPAEQLKSFAKVLQIADPGQWFRIHKIGGYQYWEIKYYLESGKIKGFIKPASMKCCSTDFTQN